MKKLGEWKRAAGSIHRDESNIFFIWFPIHRISIWSPFNDSHTNSCKYKVILWDALTMVLITERFFYLLLPFKDILGILLRFFVTFIGMIDCYGAAIDLDDKTGLRGYLDDLRPISGIIMWRLITWQILALTLDPCCSRTKRQRSKRHVAVSIENANRAKSGATILGINKFAPPHVGTNRSKTSSNLFCPLRRYSNASRDRH